MAQCVSGSRGLATGRARGMCLGWEMVMVTQELGVCGGCAQPWQVGGGAAGCRVGDGTRRSVQDFCLWN